jgi:hypothetical protein
METPLSVLSLQVCYLCHSLLTLAGVVVSSQDISPDQWVSLLRCQGWVGQGTQLCLLHQAMWT